uniref:Uncharacterized protein n=1 Tax=Candidatus Kentrum sp. TUN TaxID=2126343 RepID=A0A450ZMZ8_9GAMM|nr:MAG: hypothetical protein BECKTUN1418D_GA0071000_102814 [Candidatus Kentron sp. TUN]
MVLVYVVEEHPNQDTVEHGYCRHDVCSLRSLNEAKETISFISPLYKQPFRPAKWNHTILLSKIITQALERKCSIEPVQRWDVGRFQPRGWMAARQRVSFGWCIKRA